jgi:hypothetical protein
VAISEYGNDIVGISHVVRDQMDDVREAVAVDGVQPFPILRVMVVVHNRERNSAHDASTLCLLPARAPHYMPQ